MKYEEKIIKNKYRMKKNLSVLSVFLTDTTLSLLSKRTRNTSSAMADIRAQPVSQSKKKIISRSLPFLLPIVSCSLSQFIRKIRKFLWS